MSLAQNSDLASPKHFAKARAEILRSRLNGIYTYGTKVKTFNL